MQVVWARNYGIAPLSEMEEHRVSRLRKTAPSVKTDTGTTVKYVFQLEKITEFEFKNTSLHYYIITEKCIDVKKPNYF